MNSSASAHLPRLRQYLTTDRPALLAVIDQVCAEGVWMRTDRYIPNPAWEHALDQPGCPCHLLLLAATVDGLPVGWCRLFPEPFLAAGDAALVAELGLGLLTPYRDQGVGARMLRRSVAWAVQRGLVSLRLETRRDNRRAIHLFQKIGFSPRFVETQNLASPQPGWLSMNLPLPIRRPL